MDEKFVRALCVAYGNYRVAISTWDANDNTGEDDARVLGAAKAILTLQDALGIEVADPKQVQIVIDAIQR